MNSLTFLCVYLCVLTIISYRMQAAKGKPESVHIVPSRQAFRYINDICYCKYLYMLRVPDNQPFLRKFTAGGCCLCMAWQHQKQPMVDSVTCDRALQGSDSGGGEDPKKSLRARRTNLAEISHKSRSWCLCNENKSSFVTRAAILC